MWQDNILRCYLRFSFLNFFYSFPSIHLVNAFIAPGKGCYSRKANKRLLNFWSLSLWGEKNTVDPERTQVIKIRWENTVTCSQTRFVWSCHTPCFLLSPPSIYELPKFLQPGERGKRNTQYVWKPKKRRYCGHSASSGREKPLKPRKEAGCKVCLMSRSSRMNGSVWMMYLGNLRLPHKSLLSSARLSKWQNDVSWAWE